MGRKKLKRKLARRVLAGKLTVGEARARLGREMVQKSAAPPRPVQPAPGPRYPGDDAYIMSAFAPIPRPVVTKNRKAPVQPRLTPQQLLAKARADARDISGLDRLAASGARPPVIVKQLSSVDRAMVAALRGELGRAAHIPARREEINAELARLTGLPSGGVWPF